MKVKGEVVGVGVDMEPAASFRRKKLSKNRRFYERIFSAAEIAYCGKFRDPSPRFAARFCAKEAVIKAAGPHIPLNITDCEVRSGASGAPEIHVRSKKSAVVKFFSRHTVFLSLSHTDDAAIAFAVLVRKPKGK